MPETETRGAQTATTVTVDAKPKRYQPPQGPTIVEIREYPQGRFRLYVDQHDLPYIELQEITDQWRFDYRAADVTDEARRIGEAVDRGERVFSLTLDGRFGHTATESELHHWIWFLANAMAIAAGYTSHGPNSRRINRHGVSL